jgi:hypothetical protein
LDTLRWARDSGLVAASDELDLTESGEAVVGEWSRAARLDW